MEIILKVLYYAVVAMSTMLVGGVLFVMTLNPASTRKPSEGEVVVLLLGAIAAFGLLAWAGHSGHEHGRYVQGIFTSILAVAAFVVLSIGGILAFGRIGHH
jgi:hypothetical protein